VLGCEVDSKCRIDQQRQARHAEASGRLSPVACSTSAFVSMMFAKDNNQIRISRVSCRLLKRALHMNNLRTNNRICVFYSFCPEHGFHLTK